MSEIITIGLDLAKHVFQVHGADGARRAGLRKRIRRTQVLEFFSQFSAFFGSKHGNPMGQGLPPHIGHLHPAGG